MLGAQLEEELLVVTARMFRAAPCWRICVHNALHSISGALCSIPRASVTVSPGQNVENPIAGQDLLDAAGSLDMAETCQDA